VTANAAQLLALLRGFPDRRVLVVGDLVADEYLLCRTSRVSREAPAALVLTYQDRQVRCGGAANAVANIRSLGGMVEPVGVVGEDGPGRELLELLAGIKVDTSGIVVDPSARTVVKTRVMASTHHSTKQQVLRVDRDCQLDLNDSLRRRLGSLLDEKLSGCDALLIADYGYGSADPELVAGAVASARQRGIPVTLDSRHRPFAYPGVTAATPNEEELEEAAGGSPVNGEPALAVAGEALRERLGAEAVLVTLGSRGMALFERNRPMIRIQVYGTDEVADVTGAGDTVIAAFTLALSGGAGYEQAARLANYAGGLVVMKRGTATVSQAELAVALGQEDG
jgi:rfaE bifunctional protein kinase chain/domain